LIDGSTVPPAAGATCSNYAEGFDENPISFTPPEVQTVGGANTAYVQSRLSIGYHGPGTYTSRSNPQLGGAVAIGVGDLEGSGYIDTFRSGPPGTTTLTVNPDGSGRLVFSSWSGGDTTISGTVIWTCG